MFFDVSEGEGDVGRGLGQPRREIGERVAADEIVILQQTFDPLGDDLGREHLGEARGDGFEQRAVADKIDIGVDREAGCRQQPCGRDHIFAIEAEPVGQPQPARDPTGVLAFTVMVDDASAPFPAQRRCRQPGDQIGVLRRNPGLIVIAIERPGLNLTPIELPVAHQVVKRVAMMVALLADLPEGVLQIRAGQ